MTPKWQHHYTTTTGGWWRKGSSREQRALRNRWRQTGTIRKTDSHLQSQVTLESQISQQITDWQTALLWEQIIKPSLGLAHCRKGKLLSNSLQCCREGVLASESKHGNSLINTRTQAYFSFAVKCCSPLYEFEFKISQLNWNNSRAQMKQIPKPPNICMKYIPYILSVTSWTVWVDKGSCVLLLVGWNLFSPDRTGVEVPQYNQ